MDLDNRIYIKTVTQKKGTPLEYQTECIQNVSNHKITITFDGIKEPLVLLPKETKIFDLLNAIEAEMHEVFLDDNFFIESEEEIDRE